MPLAVSGGFFILGSLFMGLAINVPMLIVGRALLGFGVAGACLVSACRITIPLMLPPATWHVWDVCMDGERDW